MNKVVTIFETAGCAQCMELRNKVLANRMEYLNIPYEKYASVCDEVTNLINVFSYPIVKLIAVNGDTWYLYLSESETATAEISANTYSKGLTSVDNMIDLIKQL